MKTVFGGLFSKRNAVDKDHKSLSQFQALAVAISAQIGTGNVAGVATAITTGGPAFYITHGLSAKIGQFPARVLATFFSIAIIIALGFIGNATQANSIASAGNGHF